MSAPAAVTNPLSRVKGAVAQCINILFDFLTRHLIATKRTGAQDDASDTEKPSAKITSNYLSYYKLLISVLVNACVSVQIHLIILSFEFNLYSRLPYLKQQSFLYFNFTVPSAIYCCTLF